MFSWNYEHPCLLGLPSGRGPSRCHWCLSLVPLLLLSLFASSAPSSPWSPWRAKHKFTPIVALFLRARGPQRPSPKRWKKGAHPCNPCPCLSWSSAPVLREPLSLCYLLAACWGWKVFSDVWGKAHVPVQALSLLEEGEL